MPSGCYRGIENRSGESVPHVKEWCSARTVGLLCSFLSPLGYSKTANNYGVTRSYVLPVQYSFFTWTYILLRPAFVIDSFLFLLCGHECRHCQSQSLMTKEIFWEADRRLTTTTMTSSIFIAPNVALTRSPCTPLGCTVIVKVGLMAFLVVSS